MTYTLLNCATTWQTSECIRSIILFLLYLFTFIACLIQIFRIIRNSKQRWTYQLLILYFAALETIIGTIHYSVASTHYLDVWINFCKALQLCIIAYYFSAFVLFLYRKETLLRRLIWPFFAIIILGLLIIAILSTAGVITTKHHAECFSTSVLFASLDFCCLLLSITFLICGICITRAIDSRVSENLRKKKTSELATLMLIYFTTTLFVFSLNLTIAILNGKNDSKYCEIFTNDYSYIGDLISALMRIISYLLPVWAVLILVNDQVKTPRAELYEVIQDK
eukprot:TRINITY_DN7606_c0_g1_i1.p1 TRINITY_DN7606_c0_g1~~TRINITY_DN7606_c0_g1_i1.p1  ORF type:complete len:306 (+),score=82.85 TRINITY_DN7606_c0_g1_i1:80-919(+)